MEQGNTLGKRIAMLRKNQGWTQEQLGEKVGVSAQAVSKWENDLACPDISVIPLLADLFGITTDELLGVKPIEPHVVILDKEPDEPNTKKGEASFSLDLHDVDHWSGIVICITAILVCVMLIIRSTTPLFNHPENGTWNYIWPILVFGVGLLRVRKNSIFGIVAMAVGVYEFIWFGWGVPFEIKWYVLLLILAVAGLVRILLEKLGVLQKRSHFVEVHGETPNHVSEYSDEGDFLRAELAFGSNSIVYPRDTLQGMKVETSFGDHNIDLRNVRFFPNTPILDLEVSFGNVILYLPSNVRLIKNSETAFAAIRIKGSPDEDALQTVYLKGEVNFGNLEVRYPNA